MIVRVLTEGQYEIEDGTAGELNELDTEVQSALDAGDEAGFRQGYGALLEKLRAAGSRVPDDDLRASDLILPPPDATLEEARDGLDEHGLIPD